MDNFKTIVNLTTQHPMISKTRLEYVDCPGCAVCERIEELRPPEETKKERREVLTMELGEEIKREVKIPGEMVELAAKHGISRSTLWRRVEKLHMPVYEAATTPSFRKRIFTDQQIETAASNGISYSTLQRRRKAGWDVDRAITTPPDQKHRSQKKRTMKQGQQSG